MQALKNTIESAFEDRANITPKNASSALKEAIFHVIELLDSGQARVATLRSGAAPVGNVVLTAGSPSWVVMTFHRPGWSGWVYCVVTENGHSKRIGSFWVQDGEGSWAVRLSGSGSAITTARVEALSGSVFATAEFAT